MELSRAHIFSGLALIPGFERLCFARLWFREDACQRRRRRRRPNCPGCLSALTSPQTTPSAMLRRGFLDLNKIRSNVV